MTDESTESTCDVVGCEDVVDNFPEPFPAPSEVSVTTDDRREAVMCDHHHVAARLLAYTRSEPPYVDVGLYQETTYYARALAAETFGIPAREKVTRPQDAEETEDE